MARRGLVVGVVLSMAVSGGLAAQDPPPPDPDRTGMARITGSVVDRVSHQPLEAVALTIRLRAPEADEAAPARTTMTDERGRFSIRGLLAGVYDIEVRRIGYGTIADSLFLPAATELRVAVEIVPTAVELDPIIVSVTRLRHLDAVGFYGRREMRLGRFLAREEIEARNAIQVSDLFRTMPGVRVVSTGPLGWQNVLALRGGCTPDVYLDGAIAVEGFMVDETLAPEHIDGIEVYSGATAPAQYAGSPCGAVLVWTRRPDGADGRAFSWRRVFAVFGAASGVYLLMR